MAELRYQDDWLHVWNGDCRDAMREMPEHSVHSVITSPPFYGLRDYGTATWTGGDPDCDHKKVASGRGTNIPQTKNPGVDYPIAPHRGGDPNVCVRCGAIRVEPTIWGGDRHHGHVFGAEQTASRGRGPQGDKSTLGGATPEDEVNRLRTLRQGADCECGAWRGALGLEPTPAKYVEHLVEVFREVWRVLRPEGVAWLNLGDSYVSTAGSLRYTTGSKDYDELNEGDGRLLNSERIRFGKAERGNLKSKDLIGVPWMAAFALRDDGWYLRSDIVWAKPNAMPESVEDRPTRSHEFIFMLTKQRHYFYDHIAVKEPVGEAMIAAAKRKPTEPGKTYQHDEETRFGKTSPNRVWSDPAAVQRLLAGRNKRDVWEVATVSYPGAHYATFPPKLVEPMILASTSGGGVCSECGAPYKRVTEDVGVTTAKGGQPHDAEYGRVMHGMDDLTGNGTTGDGFAIIERETIGWAPTCEHAPEQAVPATVLDPFGGSGTVAMVAQQHGRKAVLIDLSDDYIEQQMVRNRDIPLGL